MAVKVNIVQIITLLASIVGWFKSKQSTWDYLVKVTTPLIAQAEEMAKDGVIDRAERKALVMQAIAQAEKDGKIKLNRFTRWLVNRVVDNIAKKLPDIRISMEAKALMKK